MKSQCRWKTEESRKIWPGDMYRHIYNSDRTSSMPLKAFKVWRYSNYQSCLRIRNRTTTSIRLEVSHRVQSLKSYVMIVNDCHLSSWLHGDSTWQRESGLGRLSNLRLRYRGPPTLPGRDVDGSAEIMRNRSRKQASFASLLQAFCKRLASVLHDLFVICFCFMHDAWWCRICVLFVGFRWFYMVSWQSSMVLELGFPCLLG